jgi:hypothetical protein
MPVPFWLPLCFAPATPPHCPLTPLPASDQTTPQVTALMAAPFLMDHPAAASIFPADAIARARKMYKMFGGALGAYTDSRGNAGVRQVRCLVWPGGARLGLAWLGLVWRGPLQAGSGRSVLQPGSGSTRGALQPVERRRCCSQQTSILQRPAAHVPGLPPGS